MRLLLTSAGIKNKTLAKALRRLVKGKVRIAFIPTAANVEKGDKDWLIKNYSECAELGSVDIVDISALDKRSWLQRLRQANVLVFGGGNTKYLMKCIWRSGLVKELPNLLKNRVYVGISAGSILTAKSLASSSEYLFSDKKAAPAGLNYVDFYVTPHFNSQYFPKKRDKYLKPASKRLGAHLYALDDESGALCVNGKVRIISEGKWKRY